MGWWSSIPTTELDFLHDLPVELMWGVGPVTKARLAEIGVLTIGQLAQTPGWSLERLLGPAAGQKLAALAWNRDPREIKTHRRARSAGAQSALGKKPAEEQVFRPTLLSSRRPDRHPAPGQVAAGRTVTVRVRFADLHAVTRSVTLDAPISATAILAEIAEDLVRTVLAQITPTRRISLLAISVSHLEKHSDMQLDLPLGLEDEARRPGSKRGHRALCGRPRRRPDPRSLRMGSGRIRVGRLGIPARCRTIFASSPKRTSDQRRQHLCAGSAITAGSGAGESG